jgi:hypothetical protein
MPPKSRETLCAPRALGKEFVLIVAAELAAIQKAKRRRLREKYPRIKQDSKSAYSDAELIRLLAS